jgi:CRISPR-associated protein Csm2
MTMVTLISKQVVEQILKGDAKTLVDEAERFGKELANDKLTKSQIRGIFGTVRQIKAAWDEKADAKKAKAQLRRVLLLKPRLAYQAKREEKVKPLADVLTLAIDKVAEVNSVGEQTERFGYFTDLFEAILAYHTAYGGK